MMSVTGPSSVALADTSAPVEKKNPAASLDSLLNSPALAPEKAALDSNPSPEKAAFNQSLSAEVPSVMDTDVTPYATDGVLDAAGTKAALTALKQNETADNDKIQALKKEAKKVYNDPNLSAAEKMSKLDKISAEQQTLFKGIIVIGLVALWVMADIMNDAIDSTQDSQTLTQNLQENMTQAGLNWSNEYSQALQAQADAITAESNSSDDTNTKSMKINALTSKFNQINSDSQASSSFTSGLTNAINNAISAITQAIQIDIQNVQQGVQKLFDTMAQLQ